MPAPSRPAAAADRASRIAASTAHPFSRMDRIARSAPIRMRIVNDARNGGIAFSDALLYTSKGSARSAAPNTDANGSRSSPVPPR